MHVISRNCFSCLSLVKNRSHPVTRAAANCKESIVLKNLYVGDELIITILNSGRRENDIRLEKRQKLIDSAAYVMKTERNAEEVDAYIKELRSDDRF